MIKGFVPISFVDWPGHPASVIFFGGCNLKCWWCHNAGLAYGAEWPSIMGLGDVWKYIPWGWVDGIVLSGGEPLIQEGLLDFVRDINLPVMIETNGTRPDVLKALLPYLKFVAMDIKSKEDYGDYFGSVLTSIRILRDSKVEHEFRSTMYPGRDISWFKPGFGKLVELVYRP